ncbi:hypothetical protein AgCh_022833 [Apium graveolens]
MYSTIIEIEHSEALDFNRFMRAVSESDYCESADTDDKTVNYVDESGEAESKSNERFLIKYYKNVVVMEMKNGGVIRSQWRELGDMWEEGERRQLGRIAVIDGQG